MPSLGEMGGGMPSLGTGASGFGQQLADLIGGLVGSGASEATGEDTSDDALTDQPDLDPADEIDEPGEGVHDEEAETEPANATEESATDDEAAPQEEPEPPEPAVTPVPSEPAPPVPPAVPEAMPVEQTPCEIAADELPQVGE
jgi:hypothetical protein